MILFSTLGTRPSFDKSWILVESGFRPGGFISGGFLSATAELEFECRPKVFGLNCSKAVWRILYLDYDTTAKHIRPIEIRPEIVNFSSSPTFFIFHDEVAWKDCLVEEFRTYWEGEPFLSCFWRFLPCSKTQSSLTGYFSHKLLSVLTLW